MLFVLSEDILPFCNEKSGPELEGLQNLLLCVRQGRHAVTGPYSVFRALAENRNLAHREQATAKGLANRRTELKLLEQIIRQKVFINLRTDSRSLEILPDNSWQICISELNSKFLSELVVLGENIIDAELYQQAGRHHKIKHKIKGVDLRSSARGGGGSQIDVEFCRLLDDGIPVFAITDGDFKFPCMPPSVTSARCHKLVSDERGLGWHFMLPVREIENIIPDTVLLEVADQKVARDAHDSVMPLSGTSTTDANSPRCYTCLKSGITLSEAFASEKADERTYWVGVAQIIKNKRPKKFSECLDQNSCSADQCLCRINVGYGKDVLTQVKKWLASRSCHSSLQQFDKSDVWMRIGALIFDAGVAFPPSNI